KALAPNLGAFGLPALIQDSGFNQLYASLEASQPRMLEPLSPIQLRERAVLPDMTYSDAVTFTLGQENPIHIDVASVNRFAPGSSIVTVRDSNIYFTGWLVAGNEPPALQRANIDAWLQALASLRRNRKLKFIVPANGPIGDMSLVVRTQQYLKEAQSAVRKAVRAHKPREHLALLTRDLVAVFAHASGDNQAQQRNALIGLERIYDEMVAQTIVSEPAQE
ncbi:MAG TPA: hypothetical protein VGK87_05030, partial [Anaerolineae bacterium]